VTFCLYPIKDFAFYGQEADFDIFSSHFPGANFMNLFLDEIYSTFRLYRIGVNYQKRKEMSTAFLDSELYFTIPSFSFFATRASGTMFGEILRADEFDRRRCG